MFSRIPLFLSLLHLTSASQPEAPAPIPAPLRDLPWGQLNFLHTTDTHGWHGGHLSEAQYSADWGDYISFASHLRNRTNAEKTDLLVVDTGDRIEGNGLYDASEPKGKYTYRIFTQQHLDVITVGNHELYLQNSSEREYDTTVPAYRESYIASNLDIHNPKTGELEALAPRFRKFTTPNQGIRVLAFGFLFNFQGNADNTVVQPVQATVKEEWFQDAIRDKEVDLFLVAGHVPVRDSEEFELIYQTIRSAQWDAPIAFLGGHTHIRDFREFDDKAYGLESGRYMETIGFMSIKGLKTGGKKAQTEEAIEPQKSSPVFKRRYIDNNLLSLHHHSQTNVSTFPTELGTNVTRAIHSARKALNLDHTFGCAPQDYWLSRAHYPSDTSLLTWLEKRVLPDTFTDATSRPSIVLTNSGAMRFDIFKGPFTVDSTFLLSPFGSGFRRIKDVPYEAASQVLQVLNHQGQILLERTEGDEPPSLEMLRPPFAPQRLDPYTADTGFASDQSPLLADSKSSLPGYTTRDDFGHNGDDTVHAPIDFYAVPNCIAASVNYEPTEGPAPEKADLVYNEFVQNWVLLALKYLGQDYESGDTRPVLEGSSFTEVIARWVGENWECEDGEG
ncbi:hypothetical protein MBLNU230_g5386t1 [Neophaeotheca triangularis]